MVVLKRPAEGPGISAKTLAHCFMFRTTFFNPVAKIGGPISGQDIACSPSLNGRFPVDNKLAKGSFDSPEG
jgi:hypothetical protein